MAERRTNAGMHDVDGLNSGYAALLLEQYLSDPASVPEEWRSLFESGASDVVAAHPVLRRFAEPAAGNGRAAVAGETSSARSAGAPDELLGGVAAAMALVKA